MPKALARSAALAVLVPYSLPDAQITQIISATGDGAGNPLDRVKEIAVDASNNVFVAGGISDNAFKITPAEVVSEIIGTSGDGSGNTLNGTTNLAVDNAGNVYVTGVFSDNAFKINPAGTIKENSGGVGPNLLCNVLDPSGELLGFPTVAASGGNYVATIPADPGLCGVQLSLQGLMTGGVTPFAFTEAIDQVIGL